MKTKLKREIRQNRHVCKQDQERLWDFIFFTSFVLVTGLSVWTINIFRMTVIAPRYLLVTGSLGVIVVRLLFLFVMKFSLSFFKTCFLALSVGGCIPCFLLLYLNKSLANKEITSKVFAIQKTGNLANGRYGRCGIPYAAVDFEGYEKQLIFSCAYERSIHTFTRVRIDYYEGYWGFPVIQAQELVK